MKLAGSSTLPASRDAVWEALNDPAVLQASIPGCQSLEREGEHGFIAKVKSKIGPVSATFSGKVTLSDIDPGNGYTISGEGTGGAAGFAKGGARVTLTDEGEATLLSYEVEAQVGGKLAQLGSRLVDGVAKKMSDQFFANFAAQIEKRFPSAGKVPAKDAARPAGAKSGKAAPDGAADHTDAPAPIARTSTAQAQHQAAQHQTAQNQHETSHHADSHQGGNQQGGDHHDDGQHHPAAIDDPNVGAGTTAGVLVCAGFCAVLIFLALTQL